MENKTEVAIFITFCVAMIVIGGLLTRYVLFPCPLVTITSGVTVDTVYVTHHDTIYPPPIVETITEFISVPTEPPKPDPLQPLVGDVIGDSYTYAHKNTPHGRVEVKIYADCQIDSVKLRVAPAPIDFRYRCMSVVVDSISVVTIKKDITFKQKMVWAVVGAATFGVVSLLK